MLFPNKPAYPAEPGYLKYIPWVTVICTVACIILFIGINTETTPPSWDAYKKWGCPSANDIWNGSYWGLLTSNFLHIATWHIAFNIYWFWLFGKRIEYLSSKLFFIVLILSSSIICSASQLSFSGVNGNGLSGVIYAFFGYALVQSKINAAYKTIITKKVTIWLIAWLLICIVLSYMQLWQVGNAAHVAGFFWGILLGRLYKYTKTIQIAVPATVFSLLFITVFWSPWSINWLSNKAYNLEKDEKFQDAAVIYRQILKKDKQDTFAIKSLQLIEIDSLSKAAYNLHSNKQFKEARELYKQILSIDSANKWAKENLTRLPAE